MATFRQKIPLGANNKNSATQYIANLDEATISSGMPFVYNIGFSEDGVDTFTVHGSDGTALSAPTVQDGNPGALMFEDPDNPGQLIGVTVDENHFIVDDRGASNMVGNTFGDTAGVAWGNSRPGYLYAILNDTKDGVAFAVGRIPHLKVAPAVADLGSSSSATADKQSSLFLLDTASGAPTLGDFDGNPVLLIGGFEWTKSASDDSTFLTMTEDHGVGKFMENISYTMPTGQNGAASGKFFHDNGGTAPGFSSGKIEYKVSKEGDCTWYANFEGAANNGAGAVTSYVVSPYKWDSVNTGFSGVFVLGNLQGRWNNTGYSTLSLLTQGAAPNRASFQLSRHTDDGTMQNGDWINSKLLRGTVRFRIGYSE